MKLTYLGQAGLLFKFEKLIVMVDPYMSDSVQKLNPANYRRVPVNETFFTVKPDILVFTHNHLDHYDPETVRHYVNTDSSVTVLAPVSVWNDVRKTGGSNNYVMFNRHTVWTHENVKFTAVRAEHSDASAIGVIIDDGKKKYYITGDTLYNEEIFDDIPKGIDVLFLPVNGVGNNMNMIDAADFAERINPEKTVPIHIGMFDDLSAENFKCQKKVVLKIYKEIQL